MLNKLYILLESKPLELTPTTISKAQNLKLIDFIEKQIFRRIFKQYFFLKYATKDPFPSYPVINDTK